MSALQTLRQARWISRLVLVWFALFLGAAVASPVIKPVGGQMVCSAMGGMKMVVDGQDDAPPPLQAPRSSSAATIDPAIRLAAGRRITRRAIR